MGPTCFPTGLGCSIVIPRCNSRSLDAHFVKSRRGNNVSQAFVRYCQACLSVCILATIRQLFMPFDSGRTKMSQQGDHTEGTIETLMHEERVYAPSAEFVAQANINSE